jgi:WD40 repeat protein
MNAEDEKPVVFLAFANEQEHRVSYLRKLPDESRNLRRALEEAADKGLCEPVVRTNATLDDCLEVLRKYRNRIAVFHFGGHADCYRFLFEGEAGKRAEVDAKGFAALLGEQAGLQLVFLNACATQEQVHGLQEVGVPVVIATSCDILDEVATEFATQFYKGLANGAGIRTAYNEAVGAVKAQRGGVTRTLRPGVAASDRWPWDPPYVRPGAEEALMWNLPEAVGDPYFGLPPLPVRDLPQSPYRHLEWFDREHAEIFFGRGYQIRDLYERVTSRDAAPIILLYGQSGVGKSSLLAAGLMPRLEASHGVYYTRRDQKKGLAQTLGDGLLPESREKDLLEAWLAHEKQSAKPFAIILDQIEEVFTRPNSDQADELSLFLEKLTAIFGDQSRRPREKLILGFRKEWLAEIERLLSEQKLPISKVFLKRLDRRGVIEAVEGPARSERLTRQYGLRVDEDLSGLIADDLLEDRDSPIAPTLQILLTKMWSKAKEADFDHPMFSRDLYEKLKRDGILLKDFLNQQLAVLETKQADVVKSGLALDVLAFHTTPLGTSEEHTANELKEVYRSKAEAVENLVGQCKELYLLADPAQNRPEAPAASRLAHDTIAPFVRRLFTTSDKPGQRARRILENRAVDWKDGKKGNPLDEADLKVVEDGAAGMRDWTPDGQRMVQASRKEREKRIRRRQVLFGLGIAAIVAIVVAAGIAIRQSQLAKDQEEIAKQQARVATARQLAAQAQSTQGNYPQRSLLLALEALATTSRAGEARVPIAEEVLRQALANAGGRGRGLWGHERSVSVVAISPDNRWLVTGSIDKTARLWDLTSEDPAASPIVLRGHESIINAVAISQDNRWLVTGSEDKTARLWDLTSKDPAASPIVLRGHENVIRAVAISQDNRWLVTGSIDETARLWDLSSEDPAASPIVLRGHEAYIRAVAISPDNHWLVTGSDDKTARLWDLTSKDPAASPIVLRGHEADIGAVAISPDNHWLVTGSDDETARLWDLTSKEPAASPIVLRGHEGYIYAVAISPDNRWLVTGSIDKTARLWDLTSKDPAASPIVLRGHEAEVSAVAISPDNHWLVTGSVDGTARLWDLRLDELIELACRTVGRNMTKVEWEQYLGNQPYQKTCPNLP